MTRSRLRLFNAYGVELEYMIVDRETLSIRPIADEVLRDAAGAVCGELEFDDVSWSNELALHVIELKTTAPARSLPPLAAQFQQHVTQINAALAPLGAQLMPTAMHPWMNPEREMRLWPHDYGDVYAAFDRIFDCRGHGWANLQSVHLNLPFADDAEFGRLHAAIRLVLPLLPALAASSPFVEGRRSRWLDSRLEFYRHNARRVPIVSGSVIPEPVFSEAAYQATIYQAIDAAIRPLDADGVLNPIWVNARGAIARFDRGSIEIRLLDVQECPAADLAICAAVSTVLQALVNEERSSTLIQQNVPTTSLVNALHRTVECAGDAAITDADHLLALRLDPTRPHTALSIWRTLLESTSLDADHRLSLNTIFEQGSLAQRILRAAGDEPSSAQLTEVYRRLCDCLANGQWFHP